MKIGIVTFFCVPNYGAMLQAYALWHYLKDRGHEVEFIDYAFGNTRRMPLWKCFFSRNIANWIGVVRKKLALRAQFEITQFSASFPRTKRVSTFPELIELGKRFDTIIVGSDQMWNPLWCSKSSLPIVLLDFAAEKVKRISYAVSFGTREWQKEQNAELAGKLLRKFDAISVREKSGAKLVYSLAGRNDAQILLDPTLLYTSTFYIPLFNVQTGNTKERYIFSYFLEDWTNNENITSIVNVVSQYLGIQCIHSDKKAMNRLSAPICHLFNVKTKISVGAWLWEIANADFIVTNSFHGTVFAILFHKPFVTMLISGKMSGMNERVISLLQMVGLEARAINFNEIPKCRSIVANKIDWASVDKKLAIERLNSYDFIHTSLE